VRNNKLRLDDDKSTALTGLYYDIIFYLSDVDAEKAQHIFL